MEHGNNVSYPVDTLKKSQFIGIDILKLIFSFFVVGIHIAPFSVEQFQYAESVNFWLRNYVFRLAVPFYFTSSGFLLFRKLDLNNLDVSLIREYCFKMLRLLGIWTVLLAAGRKGHLWYMGATVIAVIGVGLCFYWRLKYWQVAVISLGLYGIGLLGDSYYGLLESMRSSVFVDIAAKGYEYFFKDTRNGLFMGFVFVLMGAGFGQMRFEIKTKLILLGCVLSLLMLGGEIFVLESHSMCKDYNVYISLIPVTFFVFMLALRIKLPKISGETMRGMGTLIYFLHMFCYAIMSPMFGILQKYLGLNMEVVIFPATLLFVAILAWFIVKLSRKEKLKWLSFLYK